jgi:hypothetical protein
MPTFKDFKPDVPTAGYVERSRAAQPQRCCSRWPLLTANGAPALAGALRAGEIKFRRPDARFLEISPSWYAACLLMLVARGS